MRMQRGTWPPRSLKRSRALAPTTYTQLRLVCIWRRTISTGGSMIWRYLSTMRWSLAAFLSGCSLLPSVGACHT